MTDTEVSWRGITVHSPLITSDGTEVGKITEVAALDQEDIFHGVVFKHHTLGHMLLAPAADIGEITDEAVHLSVDADAAEKYEQFHPLVVERLGLKGLFRWKHLAWKESDK